MIITNNPQNNINCQINNNVIQPLSIGNKWTYSFVQLDTNGNIIDSLIIYRNIDKITRNGNISWYEISDNLWKKGITMIDEIYNSNDGLHSLTNETDSIWKNELLFKYPASNGDKYDVFLLYGVNNWNVEIQDNVYKIKIDTIIYYCYKYSFKRHGEIRYIYYYSPGIGLIMQEYYDKNIITAKKILISYSLK